MKKIEDFFNKHPWVLGIAICVAVVLAMSVVGVLIGFLRFVVR